MERSIAGMRVVEDARRADDNFDHVAKICADEVGRRCLDQDRPK